MQLTRSSIRIAQFCCDGKVQLHGPLAYLLHAALHDKMSMMRDS